MDNTIETLIPILDKFTDGLPALRELSETICTISDMLLPLAQNNTIPADFIGQDMATLCNSMSNVAASFDKVGDYIAYTLALETMLVVE